MSVPCCASSPRGRVRHPARHQRRRREVREIADRRGPAGRPDDNVTGIVYDYVGVNGIVPAQHPLNSPAKLYQSGPDRRSTPP
jgi:hypothetical protein